MDILKKHEAFEIEVLEKLKNTNFLGPLVFIDGTMLRLCYDLNRYSTDLVFWFIRKVEQKKYFFRLKNCLSKFYKVTDAQAKFNSILFEIRANNYPKRLKIEIRREAKKCDFEEKISFSKFSNKQVLLRVLTLEQAMKNKLDAALNRKDIRDFFDIEFLLKRGISINAGKSKLKNLKTIVEKFKPNDFKVTLGSVLGSEDRKYYVKNGFDFLLKKINADVVG